ncbi:hypothetical protein L211DRAFT_867093 [Terfezia boudieri ATCC MYA-4762]|uniref:Uncharacterized protein n=1 Tax=Terfezia boudieri ATCC MYA-4762 TaxID=1051890 RepID=A0A3N4LRU8_9PEZI|nr:hypothetical protein L211DRAFT_867093 [Terfezia boudieri ATCC MYA-4762]
MSVRNDKQQTTTHPPEAAPEALQIIDENKPIVTLYTVDNQDTVSVRGAWVQDIQTALYTLGTGPGDGSTTTDGGQNLMTPDSATAMSMRPESLSTPTVTGGGCPSDEPSESQCARVGHEGTEGDNQNIISCSDVDADLLLHVRYQSGQDATTEINAPFLSLRVSATVLRMASPPLRTLLDTPPVSRSRTPDGLHQLIAIHEPRVWGRREGRGTITLILTAPNESEQLRQAALIVFNILHLNESYLPTQHPSMLQIAWVAELAWVLGCLSPIVPWIKSWIKESPAADEDTRLVSALVLGFVMGDSEAFEKASLYWLRRGRKSDFDNFEGSSLGVMIVIQAAIQRKRQEIAQRFIDILNESFHSYCVRGKKNSDQTFILGALFYALCDSSAGITIAPMLAPALQTETPSPFRLQWQPQMREQSINSLLGKLAVIIEAFNVELQLHRRDLSLHWKNPAPPLAIKAKSLWRELRGLSLKDYRPEVAKIMQVEADIWDWPEGISQLYKIADMNDDLKGTWRMMFYYLACLQLGLTLLEIFVEGRWLVWCLQLVGLLLFVALLF